MISGLLHMHLVYTLSWLLIKSLRSHSANTQVSVMWFFLPQQLVSDGPNCTSSVVFSEGGCMGGSAPDAPMPIVPI